MSNFFSVDYRMSKGNMHVDLQGYFDASAAKQLISFLRFFYKGQGRVFVDTAKLNTLTESGTVYFKEYFSHTTLVAHNLYIKGERGMEMVPQGSRVIIMKNQVNNIGEEHKCTGNCKECKCGHKKEYASDISLKQPFPQPLLHALRLCAKKQNTKHMPLFTRHSDVTNLTKFHGHEDGFVHTHVANVKLSEEKVNINGKTLSHAFSKK